MARFYMPTGKWAGNGLSNEFIKWFDPLISDVCFKLLNPDAFDCNDVDLGEQEYTILI